VIMRGLALGLGLLLLTQCGGAPELGDGLSGMVQIDGSSTVFPVSEAVAEEFLGVNPGVRVTVGISGTGGGFKKFGVGEIDISDASRPIKEVERRLAQDNGVDFIELPVAYDGISVVVNPENDFVDTLTVEELTKDSFAGIDIALFSAGGGRSKEFGPAAAAAGAVVVDNSSAFRMDPEVPLVIPEINAAAMDNRPKGIIANPNCSTIIANVPVWPLHQANPVKRMIVSTYQAASGAGMAAMLELEQQSREVLELRAHFRFRLDVLRAHDDFVGTSGEQRREQVRVRLLAIDDDPDRLRVAPGRFGEAVEFGAVAL